MNSKPGRILVMDEAKPRRVWLVISNRWNSAITEYALNVALCLRAAGWQVLLSCLQGSPCERRAKAAGLETRSLAAFDLSALRDLREAAIHLRPAAVLSFGGKETSLLQLLRRSCALKIIRFRGQDLELDRGKGFRSLLQRLRLKASARSLKALLVPSRAMQREYAELKPPCSVHFLALPSDAERYRPIAAPEHSRPILSMVARFDPVKGFPDLFRIVRELIDDLPSGAARPLLEIYGREENLKRDDLVAIAARQDLEGEKDFRLISHFVEDLPARLAASTLGLITSTGSEIICRVAHEYLLCGTPILVSGVGSLEECLFPGAGQSYRKLAKDERRVAVLALYLQALGESPDQRRQRAQAADALFGFKRAARELERLIAQD